MSATETAFDRMPPFDAEAEEAVIGALMVDIGWPLLPQVSAKVRAKDFFREKHGWIFDAIIAVWESGGEPNEIMVAHELASRDQLEAAGGRAFLSDVIRHCPTALGAPFYADIVARDACYRRLITASNQISQMAYQHPEDIATVLSRARDLIDGIASKLGGATYQSGAEVLNGGLMDRLERFIADPRALAGQPTGWSDLDLIIDGWQPGFVYVIAGETSIGKSTFVQQANQFLTARDKRTLYVSTEMRNQSVGWRDIFRRAGLDERAIKLRGEVSPDQQRRLFEAANEYATSTTAWLNPWEGALSEVRAAVHTLGAKKGVDAVVLDHIDHLIERRTASTANDVADGMRAVKRLAIECDVPVLIVSHMNRSEEKGLLARLLDGGAKERDADVVMFLRPMQREGGEWKLVTNEQAQVARGRGEPVAVALDVFKNREGPSGRVMLTWLPGGRVAQMAREER